LGVGALSLSSTIARRERERASETSNLVGAISGSMPSSEDRERAQAIVAEREQASVSNARSPLPPLSNAVTVSLGMFCARRFPWFPDLGIRVWVQGSGFRV
jgi:hypothetical protein